MLKVVLCVLGQKGLNLVKGSLDALEPFQVVHVIIGKDKEVKNDFSEEIMMYCREHNIESSIRGNIELSELSYNYVLAAGWRWLIPHVDNKLIVFHDSLLPKYRGFAPLVNALMNREPLVGVTALYGTEDYDCGNILCQKSISVVYPTTIGEMIDRISLLYRELSYELLSRFRKQINIEPGVPQIESMATYSLWRDQDDYRIDWNQSAKEIEHFISCLSYPYSGASAKVDGEIIRIISVKQIPDIVIENREAGKVIFIKNGFPVVVCGEGLLEVQEAVFNDGSNFLPLKIFRTRFL
tara:strand:+ start:34639 stop:35526 length:888 start_codon:yes stop_codon:yes gene_type:complete